MRVSLAASTSAWIFFDPIRGMRKLSDLTLHLAHLLCHAQLHCMSGMCDVLESFMKFFGRLSKRTQRLGCYLQFATGRCNHRPWLREYGWRDERLRHKGFVLAHVMGYGGHVCYGTQT